jgi:diadenosine tetraphosphate (Ap4A) HIT family hydrolase
MKLYQQYLLEVQDDEVIDNHILYYKTKNWEVFLSPNQAYLGYSIVLLNSNKKTLSDVSASEWIDFHNVIIKLENAYRKTFNAIMFNWSCLLNNVYKSKNANPQVHWHFRPRYNKKVKIGNEVFIDSEFGHHYNKVREKNVSLIMRQTIIDKIKGEV